MGISNLNNFLRKRCPQVFKKISIKDYVNKTIAVDVNLYLYRFKSIHKHKWLQQFIHMVNTFDKLGVNAVYIYDSKSPPEKSARKEERKAKRDNIKRKLVSIQEGLDIYRASGEITDAIKNVLLKYDIPPMSKRVPESVIEHEIDVLVGQSLNVTREDVRLSKEFLEVSGHPLYDSESEAETLCSYLCIFGIVDAVLSDDTDVLAYGTPKLLTTLKLNNLSCIEMTHSDIMEGVGTTKEQFTDFCIMCGTDYNPNIHNIGTQRAYKLIQQHGTIENVGEAGLDISVLNHIRIREIFSVPECIQSYDVSKHQRDMNREQEFFVCNNLGYLVKESQLRPLLTQTS